MSNSLFRLDDQVAVILGGTGSLGGSMAEALGASGARVAILGRSAERGMHRAEQIRRDGGEAVFHAADALDRESLSKARDIIEKSLGPVDILINAAGGNQP